MSQESIVSRLTALVREVGRLDAPSVGLMRPEIRSSDKFLLRDPFSGKAGTTAGAKAKTRLDKDAVGAIVIEWGYDVPTANITAFMAFLDTYEPQLLDARPGGVRYRGTYAVVSSTEKNTGSFRTIWTYRRFSDLDALSDEYEDGTQFASWVKQLRSFADSSPTANRSQQMYLLASSAKLTDL